MPIHPTALVDAAADIHPDADIGPFVVIDGPVVVGARTRVLAHATLLGNTRIGADNEIHMGVALGDTPQDRSYDRAPSQVRIGDRNVFREHVQVHRGSGAGTVTVIGDDNYFMATAHVAHNCIIGNHVTLANGAVVGGHAHIEDRVFLSGNTAVHQHVRVGTLAFLRGVSAADRDVPPFCIVDDINVIRALNRIGLRRAGFEPARIDALRRAFRILFAHRRNLNQAMAEVESEPITADVRQLLGFIRASERGVCAGPRQG